MIIKFYKGNVSLDTLATLCKITKNGTSAFHLIEAASKVGLEAKGMHCDMETLIYTKVHLPIIAHVTAKEGYQHFVVIYEINPIKEYLLVADPADKIKKVSFSKFLSIFNETILLFTPNQVKKEQELIFKDVLKNLIIKYKKDFSCFLMYSFLYTTLSIVTAFYIDFYLSSIHAGTESAHLIFLSLLFVIFHIFKNLFNFFRKTILFYINQKIDYFLTTDIFYSILSLPYTYFANRNVGEIIARMQDMNHIKDVIGQIITFLCIDFVLMVGSFVCLYLIHPLFAFLSLFFFSIALICSYFFDKIMYPLTKECQERRALESSIMVESLVGYETVKAIHIETSRSELFNRFHLQLLECMQKLNGWVQKTFWVREMIDSISYILFLTVGAFLILENHLTVGRLLTGTFLLSYFLEPAQALLTQYASFKEAKSAFERIRVLLIKKKDTGCMHTKIKGAIRCEQCSYTYDEKKYIIKNLSFDIPKGNKVMLLGKSGIGKSTLLKIIMGYYPVKGSHLFLDNIDISLYSKEALHRDIGYISQNEILFTDTLYHNITLYKSIKEEVLLKVIKVCALEELINHSQAGIHMIVEENGRNISGGEKQRIILARFLLCQFEILLIDEGTNQMDLGLERKILKNIFTVFPFKTILIVSHRVDNLDLFDQVLRFEADNKVTEVVRNGKGKYVYKQNAA